MWVVTYSMSYSMLACSPPSTIRPLYSLFFGLMQTLACVRVSCPFLAFYPFRLSPANFRSFRSYHYSRELPGH
mgnify:CR=1 FL=1|jgi:hypothetical protein